MIRVYLESPYAGDITANVEYAQKCVADCLKRGEAAFASHLFYTQPNILDDAKAEERKLGIEAGFVWGRCAEKTVVYVDRGMSKGMIQGIVDANAHGRPVEYRSLEVCDDCAIIRARGIKIICNKRG